MFHNKLGLRGNEALDNLLIPNEIQKNSITFMRIRLQVTFNQEQTIDIYKKLTSVFPRGNFPAAWISTTLCL